VEIAVGDEDGIIDGLDDGDEVGLKVDTFEGDVVVGDVGIIDGLMLGYVDGDIRGDNDVSDEGIVELGDRVNDNDGFTLGCGEWMDVGSKVGIPDSR